MKHYIKNAVSETVQFLIKAERVSSVGVRNGDLLLMGRRRDNGRWTLPGGHAEPGEDNTTCAVRELKEEAGIDIDPEHLDFLAEKKVTTYTGKRMIISAFQYRSFGEPTTGKFDPDQEVVRWEWIDVSNGLPDHIKETLHSPKNLTLKEMGLMKSRSHRYIRRYRKNNRWAYEYADDEAKGREKLTKAEEKILKELEEDRRRHGSTAYMQIEYPLDGITKLNAARKLEKRGLVQITTPGERRSSAPGSTAFGRVGGARHFSSTIYTVRFVKPPKDNNMAPPPPKYEAFVKPGAKVTGTDTRNFISEFEADFKSLTSMDSELKSAGATHFASRLKDATSLQTKMNGRLSDSTLNKVSDVIGARGLAQGIPAQMRMFLKVKREMDIVEIKNSVSEARADGYRAIHVIFKTPSGKLGELQIKTHRQQVFSGFTHDNIYKGSSEIKNDPAVIKYSKDLSDYLYDLDRSGKAEDKSKRPAMPEALTKRGIEFPWDLMDEFGTGAAAELSEATGMKFFAVMRDHKTKKNIKILEFSDFKKAKEFRDKNQDRYEVPLGYAKSKEEFVETFSEYRMKDLKKSQKSYYGTEHLFVRERRVAKSMEYFIETDLFKAGPHKYIRKYRRGSRDIYVYKDKNGRPTQIKKDLIEKIKKLAELGDPGAKKTLESKVAYNEEHLSMLRELADLGDVSARTHLKDLGINREKEKLEEALVPELVRPRGAMEESLSAARKEFVVSKIKYQLEDKVFGHLRQHSGTSFGRAVSGISLQDVMEKISSRDNLYDIIKELDVQMKRIDKAHEGLGEPANSSARNAGGYGTYGFKAAIDSLRLKDHDGLTILPRDLEVKRGEAIDQDKYEKSIRSERAEIERRRRAQEASWETHKGSVNSMMSYFGKSFSDTEQKKLATNIEKFFGSDFKFERFIDHLQGHKDVEIRCGSGFVEGLLSGGTSMDVKFSFLANGGQITYARRAIYKSSDGSIRWHNGVFDRASNSNLDRYPGMATGLYGGVENFLKELTKNWTGQAKENTRIEIGQACNGGWGNGYKGALVWAKHKFDWGGSSRAPAWRSQYLTYENKLRTAGIPQDVIDDFKKVINKAEYPYQFATTSIKITKEQAEAIIGHEIDWDFNQIVKKKGALDLGEVLLVDGISGWSAVNYINKTTGRFGHLNEKRKAQYQKALPENRTFPKRPMHVERVEPSRQIYPPTPSSLSMDQRQAESAINAWRGRNGRIRMSDRRVRSISMWSNEKVEHFLRNARISWTFRNAIRNARRGR